MPTPPARLVLWCLPVLALAGAAALQSTVALNHDVAWLLVAAGRLLDGGSYRADFFEMNMPLAILLYAPAQLLARTTGIAIASANLIWVVALIAQSVWLSVRICVSEGWIPARQAPLWAAWLVIGCTLLPGYDFAQKEHVIALLTLPFVLRTGAATTTPSLGSRIYVATLAAIGFFAKPHFAALPFLLLALQALRERSIAPLRSAEAVTLVALGIANAALVVVVFPDWFVCAQWARDLYGAYQRAGWQELFSIPWLPAILACSIAVIVVAARDRVLRHASASLLVAALYAFAVYGLQLKGWAYQFLPVAIAIFAALGLAMFHLSRTRWLATACVLVAIVFTLTTLARATARLPREAALRASAIAQTFAPAEAGDDVYAFTTTVTPVFPTVVLLNLEWNSRYPTLWPLAGIAQAEAEGHGERVATYREALVRSVVEDFAKRPPRVVLVDRRQGQFGLPPDYDVLQTFMRDPAFARVWSDYALAGTGGGFEIFVRSR